MGRPPIALPTMLRACSASKQTLLSALNSVSLWTEQSCHWSDLGLNWCRFPGVGVAFVIQAHEEALVLEKLNAANEDDISNKTEDYHDSLIPML